MEKNEKGEGKNNTETHNISADDDRIQNEMKKNILRTRHGVC